MQALFLDRDGVLNRSIVRDGKPFAPTLLDEFEFLPGVQEALELTNEAGIKNIVVTNQPDLGTGKISEEQFRLIHERCISELKIHDIKFCPHTQDDNCACRKPLPGMIFSAAKQHGIDIAQSYMIGDRWRDIECGQLAGCKANFFIDYSYNEKKPEPPYILVRTLAEAVQIILEEIQFLRLREKI
jgi:D-glycero-D-manno-heptose 1,7-bisphosphate phosphatase